MATLKDVIDSVNELNVDPANIKLDNKVARGLVEQALNQKLNAKTRGRNSAAK